MKTYDRGFQSRDLLRHNRLRVACFAEMMHVYSVRDQEGVEVVTALILVKRSGGYDHHIRLLHQSSLHAQQRCLIGSREFGELVHAVVDDELLAQIADNIGGGGHECPRSWMPKTKVAAGAAQAP